MIVFVYQNVVGNKNALAHLLPVCEILIGITLIVSIK